MQSLEEKVVIITGASSGIGAAAARALVKLGSRVVLTARSADRLDALARELGSAAISVPADVTRGEDVIGIVEKTIEHFGRVDVLLANAGIYFPTRMPEGNPDDWARLIDVNINGVFRCVHAVLPHMIAQKSGDIIVTSSISGHVDIVWEPIYSASKHAIQSFVHTLRRQMIPHHIRVGSCAPGTVANELWGIYDEEKVNERVNKRLGMRSEEVAEAILFMLRQPPHINISDLVMLPHALDL
jgi:ribitol 2-dehydrogenase